MWVVRRVRHCVISLIYATPRSPLSFPSYVPFDKVTQELNAVVREVNNIAAEADGDECGETDDASARLGRLLDRLAKLKATVRYVSEKSTCLLSLGIPRPLRVIVAVSYTHRTLKQLFAIWKWVFSSFQHTG